MQPSQPDTTRSRRRVWTLLAAILGLLVLTPTASADLLSPESGGSPNADDIDSLYWIIFALAVVIFVAVEGLLVYSLFKFKARKGAVPAQIRGNTRLEIGWTVGAALILVVLAVVTFVRLDDIRNPPESSAQGLQLAQGVTVADSKRRLPASGKSLNICVNGRQYVWRYTYSDTCGEDTPRDAIFSYEEMVVPVDTTVTLDIYGDDVIHSWWIPELGGKQDATPGYVNHTWFKIPAKFAEPENGTVFYGQCAELCGRNHANMTARVRAVSVQEFEAWREQRKTDIQTANKAVEQEKQSSSAGTDTP